MPPSIIGGVLLLVGALPSNTIPPQSPGARVAGDLPVVNIIGSAAVPSANNLLLRSTIKAPFCMLSLTITEPGAKRIVPLLFTNTYPFKV